MGAHNNSWTAKISSFSPQAVVLGSAGIKKSVTLSKSDIYVWVFDSKSNKNDRAINKLWLPSGQITTIINFIFLAFCAPSLCKL